MWVSTDVRLLTVVLLVASGICYTQHECSFELCSSQQLTTWVQIESIQAVVARRPDVLSIIYFIVIIVQLASVCKPMTVFWSRVQQRHVTTCLMKFERNVAIRYIILRFACVIWT